MAKLYRVKCRICKAEKVHLSFNDLSDRLPPDKVKSLDTKNFTSCACKIKSLLSNALNWLCTNLIVSLVCVIVG